MSKSDAETTIDQFMAALSADNILQVTLGDCRMQAACFKYHAASCNAANFYFLAAGHPFWLAYGKEIEMRSTDLSTEQTSSPTWMSGTLAMTRTLRAFIKNPPKPLTGWNTSVNQACNFQQGCCIRHLALVLPAAASTIA